VLSENGLPGSAGTLRPTDSRLNSMAVLWSPGFPSGCPACLKWAFENDGDFRVFWCFHCTFLLSLIPSGLCQGSTECRPTISGSITCFLDAKRNNPLSVSNSITRVQDHIVPVLQSLKNLCLDPA